MPKMLVFSMKMDVFLRKCLYNIIKYIKIYENYGFLIILLEN